VYDSETNWNGACCLKGQGKGTRVKRVVAASSKAGEVNFAAVGGVDTFVSNFTANKFRSDDF
jgi:hypothetical protein